MLLTMPEIKARARNVPNYLDSPQLTDSCCDVDITFIENFYRLGNVYNKK